MKRPLTIAAATILTILLLYACASTIRTGTTSFVTVTVGSAPDRALLRAEAATPWVRLKYLLAETKIMPEAYAYIPSIVQTIVVTVTAADISTPIVGIANINPNQTSASIRIEVPNGLARKFTIEGIHGTTSAVTYRASTEADLDGTDITLPIAMQFNFFGSAIFVNPASGSDLNSGLTFTSPLLTLTRALSLQSTSTPYSSIPVIYADQGSYFFSAVAARETFPLQLNPNTAIICGGKGFTSVIGGGALTGTTIMRGNTGASVDNCKIAVAFGSNGINDQTTNFRLNGVNIELSGSGTSPTTVGAILSSDSMILESTVTASGAVSGPVIGIQVNGGKPNIITGTVVSKLPTGIQLASGAGDAVISGATITGNQTGISVQTLNKPTIDQNTIANSTSTGIFVNAGLPQISNNTINGNAIGVDIEIGTVVNPTIKGNSLYCNSIADLFTNLTTTLDIRNNAWDHDGATTPAGPTEMVSVNGPFGCSSGADVCYQGAKPNFSSVNPAVPAPPACR